MAAYQYANNPQTTLSGSITAGATAISVASAAAFSTNGKFTIIVDSEIMLVTGVVGTVWTVERGAEGTAAASHNNNAPVTQILTAHSFLNAHHIDVRSYGAKGDGSTDDTTAINNAIAAAAPGSVVFLPRGTYRTTSKINLASNITLRGEGDASVIKVDHTDIGVEALGTIGSLANLASDATLGTRTVVLQAGAGAGYASGDLVWIQSEAITATVPRAEIASVESVATDTLTVHNLLLDTYATASTAKHAKVTPKQNIVLRDFAIYNTTYASSPTTDTEALLRFQYAIGVKVTNVTAYQNNASGIGVIDSRDVAIVGCAIHDLRDDSANGIFGYGIIVGGASRNIAVTGNVLRHMRHAFTTSTTTYGCPRAITITGNTVSDTISQGIDTHEPGQNIAISGNTIIGCNGAGVYVRALDVSVTGNNIYGCENAGVSVQATSARTVISNNIIRRIARDAGSFGNGIFCATGTVVITGNTISECERDGIRIGDGTAGEFTDLVIAENYCISNGTAVTGTGINVDKDVDGLTVNGNVCRSNTGYGLQFTSAVTSVTSISVVGNQMSGNTSGAINMAGTDTGIQAWGNSPTTMPGHIQQVMVTGASIAIGASADLTINLPHSYSDTNYVALATPQHSVNPSDLTVGIKTKNTGSVVVRIANRNTGAAITPTINLLTIHNL